MTRMSLHSAVEPLSDPQTTLARGKPRLGPALRLFIQSLREGVAVSHRYEQLRSRRVGHERAIAQAMAEVGGAS